jgi:hypothetical protein
MEKGRVFLEAAINFSSLLLRKIMLLFKNFHLCIKENVQDVTLEMRINDCCLKIGLLQVG